MKARLLLLGTILFFTCSVGASSMDEAAKSVRLKRYQQAFNLYLAEAKTGNPEAQYQLANMYKNGLGVKVNESKARQWLQRSSNKGWPAAQFTLAMELLNSQPKKSMALISKAADKNYSSAVLYVEQGLNKLGSAKRSGVTDAERWFFAAKHGETTLLDSLYRKLKNIELADETGSTAIFYAVQNESMAGINWLIKRKANVDRRDMYGETPLFLAVAKNKGEIVRLLMRHSKNIAQRLSNNDNLLHYAVRREASSVIPILLQQSALLNQVNKEGYTPRDLAESQNNPTLVSQLTARGVNSKLSWRGESVNNVSEARKPTRLASEGLIDVKVISQVIANDNAVLLDRLLKQDKTLVNQALESKESLLSFAVKHGHAEVVKVLLKHGAKAKLSYLHEAVSKGDTDISIALMAAGLNPLASGKLAHDAIDIAIMEKKDSTLDAVLQWLESTSTVDKNKMFSRYALRSAQFNNETAFEKFIDYVRTDVKDDLERNAAWYSAYNGNLKHLKMLLSKGVSLDTPDKLGKSPLYVAIENKCEPCLNLLLPRSNVNQATKTGQTPLMVAVYQQNSNTVQTLLLNGADVEQRNSLGNSAIYAAVEVDSVDIVQFLLDAGASSIRKNNNGYSALDLAKQNRRKSLEFMQ